ncbi:MAG: macro domain-containing protein [Endomicrobium sp.]|nr:macro domain-containing protein [Endomicrobium sp.]
MSAANEGLLRGGGVCGAIYCAAGYGLDSETNSLGNFSGTSVKCPTGEAVRTGLHNLSRNGINHIIHAVGHVVPRNGPTGVHVRQLESAYRSSFRVAAANNIRRMAFPCISTAIFGYPGDQAAHVAFNAVRNYIQTNPAQFDEIIFVCYASGGGRSLDYWYYKDLLDALP